MVGVDQGTDVAHPGSVKGGIERGQPGERDRDAEMKREQVVQAAEFAGIVIEIHWRNPQTKDRNHLLFMVNDRLP